MNDRWAPWSSRFVIWGAFRTCWRDTFQFCRDLSTAGFLNACSLLKATVVRDLANVGLLDRTTERLGKLRLRGYPHPVYYRLLSSDESVIREVLIEDVYRNLKPDANAACVVDAGANIGCATVALLKRFPNASFVLIEPDERNLEMCRKNLAPYGDRFTLLRAALWSESRPLSFSPAEQQPGHEWGIRVQPEGAGSVQGVTLDELFKRHAKGKVDFLKIDIEGAEKEVFSARTEWLGQVRNLAIEIHGNDCRSAVEQAMQPYTFQREQMGELEVFSRIAPKTT